MKKNTHSSSRKTTCIEKRLPTPEEFLNLKKGIKELRDKDAILPPEEDFALVVGRTAKITPPKQPK